MRLEVVGSPGQRAADVIAEALKERGRCALALSGGRTPAPMFRRLAGNDVDWSNVDIYQVDERVAPDGHADRNLELIRNELLDGIEGKQPRVHAMDVTADDLEEAAERYAALLPEKLDIVHLGLGSDGHTASLVPNDPVLDVRDRMVAITKPYDGYVRMTLTFPALEAAERIVFLEAGKEKAGAVRALVAGDPSMPAGRLRARDVLVIADPDAAVSVAR
ncbi:MAG TPA: 6-phosphogluconolactonase [Actinomycetota bacterium]|jgi:6-phosphogluconolactonase|nr:6-phosphogluconolactonase [Actinomycetota bacterium]